MHHPFTRRRSSALVLAGLLVCLAAANASLATPDPPPAVVACEPDSKANPVEVIAACTIDLRASSQSPAADASLLRARGEAEERLADFRNAASDFDGAIKRLEGPGAGSAEPRAATVIGLD